MALHIESGPQGATLRIEGDLTIFEVAEYRGQLLAVEPDQGPVVADLSKTGALDGAGLQLLIALRKQLEVAGSRLSVKAPAPAVLEALTISNLCNHFGVGTAPEGSSHD